MAGNRNQRVGTIFSLLALLAFFSSGSCWAESYGSLMPDSGQTVSIGSPDKKLPNDPFQSTLQINLPADAAIEKRGRPAGGGCDTLKSGQEKPRIAIIIDDMGNNQQIGEKLLDLDLNLTFSFLPYGPFTGDQEEEAWVRGHDILVHMPMEPKDEQWDPGPDALYVTDSFEQMAVSVQKNLALVPHAIGVNNHMGSLFTEDSLAMHQFLTVVRQNGLFFVDSSTSASSVGMKKAREMCIKTARRHVFLDNIHTQEGICLQLEKLIQVARTNGWAIAIAHPNDATLTALVRCRDTLLENVKVVGIHELVN